MLEHNITHQHLCHSHGCEDIISHNPVSILVMFTAVKSYLTFQYFNVHGNRCENIISHKPVDLLVIITTVRISYNSSVPLVVIDSYESMTHTKVALILVRVDIFC